MSVKLKDVAAKAGLSIATVSSVLNNYTNCGIKQETCEKVRRIASEMGYRPNALARSLKVQRTNAIGLYVGYGLGQSRDRFKTEIQAYIQDACCQFNVDFYVHANLKSRSADEIRMRLNDGRVDGVIVQAAENDPIAKCILDSGLPAVAIVDRQTFMPSVVGTDELGVELLVDYLWKHGHRSVMYIEPREMSDSTIRRRDMFKQFLRARGGQPTVATWDPDNAASFLRSLKKDIDRPTALFAYSDDAAYELLRAMRAEGIRCPDDFAVVGYDGLYTNWPSERSLVTVGVPWDQMAMEAVQLLKRIIEKESVPLLSCFPVRLIPGDTA